MAIDTGRTTGADIEAGEIDLPWLPELADATDLRIPGPTPLPPAVLKAMQAPMVQHRAPSMMAFYDETLRLAREMHRTSGEVYIWAGTGSAGWEIPIINLLEPGDPVLAMVNGDFGDRFAKAGQALRLDVRRVDVPWGQAVTGDDLRTALAAHADVKAVFLTHNETSTGVTNRVPELTKIAHDAGAMVFLDSVSGIGAIPLDMDASGVDVVLSGSQKAWMCPPGLVIVGFSPSALERAETLVDKGYPRFFYDLNLSRIAAREGTTATTMPLTLMYAFRAALDLLAAEGLDAAWERHARIAAITRERLSALGLELFADPAYASDSVTTFRTPEGYTAGEFRDAVREHSGIEIAVGQGPLRDTINRVGHLGWVHESEMLRMIDAIGETIGR
ncbi:MAG TPA: alanine--glyoxylate aminotransferase family protein [Thermomicrobiales bacterium]|jgi:aspartate aminotransferase-like enzyme|nr:alanine--glyoxylate aminotransferase family protein [Thermomicrobiales bacterium]